MALPEIKQAQFLTTIPSLKRNVKYRPFTVKEEKMLLLAAADKSEQSQKTIVNAMIQVISNCLTDDIDVWSLTDYDCYFLFKEIRAVSINNIVSTKYTEPESEKEYDVDINLADVKVIEDPNRNHIIKLNEEVSIEMGDPSIKLIYDNLDQEDNDYRIMAGCIKKVLVGEDDVVMMGDHTIAEQDSFLESMSSSNRKDIQQFFATRPKLSAVIKYTRDDGTVVIIEEDDPKVFFT